MPGASGAWWLALVDVAACSCTSGAGFSLVAERVVARVRRSPWVAPGQGTGSGNTATGDCKRALHAEVANGVQLQVAGGGIHATVASVKERTLKG